MKKVILLAMALFWANTAYSDDCFPRKKTIVSPNKLYTLTWKEKENADESHKLYIKSKKRGKEVLAFPRDVCIVWSPNGDQFAAINLLGSNMTESKIFDSKTGQLVANIADFLPSPAREELRNNLHGYVEVTQWTADGLVVKASGDTANPYKEFSHTFNCQQKNHSLQCSEF